MKRFLTFFLLLIMAAGILYPCCLKDACESDQNVMKTTGTPDKKEGNCSPFACGTCTSMTTLEAPVAIGEPARLLPVHEERPVITRLSDFGASYWQPPRWS